MLCDRMAKKNSIKTGQQAFESLQVTLSALDIHGCLQTSNATE